MTVKLLLSTCLLMFTLAGASAQHSPLGVWKTIDDDTGEAKSHVEIYQQDGRYFGKIVKLLRKSPDTVCEKCPGDKKDKSLVGMVVIEALEPKKDYWKNGSILDPESGNEYSCSIWFENDNADALKVRGKHWTGLFRTQTWHRVK